MLLSEEQSNSRMTRFQARSQPQLKESRWRSAVWSWETSAPAYPSRQRWLQSVKCHRDIAILLSTIKPNQKGHHPHKQKQSSGRLPRVSAYWLTCSAASACLRPRHMIYFLVPAYSSYQVMLSGWHSSSSICMYFDHIHSTLLFPVLSSSKPPP